MAKTDVTILGLKELRSTLKDIEKQALQKGALRSVMRAAAKETVLPALREQAPGNTAKAFKIKSSKGLKGGVGVDVGPTTDKFYLKFYEFGTKQRKRKSGGSTGKQEARPFIERTHKQEAPKIIQYIVENYQDMVNKYLQGRANYINKKLQKFRNGDA